MEYGVIDRLRLGLSEKRFRLTDIADASGVSWSTLHGMADPQYRNRTLENIAAIKAAMDFLEF